MVKLIDDSDDVTTEELSSAPDPVAVRAAEYAVEVTNFRREHPKRNKVLVLLLTLFIVLGTFGAIIGTVNSVDLKHQNSLLKTQQVCQTQLLQAITEEQNARANISADDRQAQKDFNNAISTAKTDKEKAVALTEYNKELAANELRRAQYPVPTFSSNVCDTKAGQMSVLKNQPSPSTGAGNRTSSSSAAPTSSPSSTPTTVRSSSSAAKKSSSAPTSVQTKGTVRTTKPSVSRSAAPTTGSSRPMSKPSPSTTSILNLPGCNLDVNLLNIHLKVC